MKFFSIFLKFLEYLYHSASALKRAAYLSNAISRINVGIPVVSVGNITTGGTGKTPVVAALADLLTPVFGRVGILSRAYGTGFVWSLNLVSDGRRVLLDRRWSGDEPVAIRKSAGITIAASGKDRVRSGEYLARKLGVRVLILDDGFQYWRMNRDLDIVLLDATSPFGGMAFLPMGRLREHPSTLDRADLVMITRIGDPGAHPFASVAAAVRLFNPRCPVIPCSFAPEKITGVFNGAELPLKSMKGRPVAAFCGIGNPESFREILRSLGARVESFAPFPDHHSYTSGEIEDIVGRAGAKGLDLFTTTKDLANLPFMPGVTAMDGPEIFVMETSARFDGGEVFSALTRKGLMPRVNGQVK